MNSGLDRAESDLDMWFAEWMKSFRRCPRVGDGAARLAERQDCPVDVAITGR